MNNKELLKKIIDDIENKNYTIEFNNGGLGSYHYSNEITNLFKILEDDDIRKIYDENISNYSYDSKKELDQKTDPESYSLVDCIIYFNWVWHLESGIAVGIVKKRIDEGKYLKVLKKLYEYL